MKNEELKLLTDNKYEGKFVALCTPFDKTVIAYGDDPCEVRKLAADKGLKEPFIFFMPEADAKYAYQF